MASRLLATPALAAAALGQTVTMLDEDCLNRFESGCDGTCFVASHREFFDDCLLGRSAPAARFLKRPIFLDGDQCESRGFRPLRDDHGPCFGGSSSKYSFFVTNEDAFWQSLGPFTDDECQQWAERNSQCVNRYDQIQV